MSAEAEWLRKFVGERAEKMRKKADVQENVSPVYPLGSRGAELRDHTRFTDNTSGRFFALGAFWNASTWGGGT